jgi:Sulfatase
MSRWLTSLGILLRPWMVLVPAVLALGLVHGLSQQAPAAALMQRLVADVLMLVRALPVWCVVLWPALVLPARGRAWLLWSLGSLLLALVLALDLYFSVAGVALGADLFAYTWDEVRTTVGGAQVSVPWSALPVLVLAMPVLWWVVWRPSESQPWRAHMSIGVLGLCVTGSLAWPARWPQADVSSTSWVSNKLVFLVGDVLAQFGANDVLLDTAYPFEHPETTPDTLGPLLALDPQNPPHLVFVVVEGLGRSFSGPGARLGSFTPFLDTLAQRSLYWDHFLANQGRTFAVLPSVLGSLPFGPYGEQPIVHDSLPSLLKTQGYQLRYFSGSDLAFDHQGALLQAMGVNQFWSAPDFKAPAHKLSEWGYPDGDLMDAVLAQPWPTAPSVTVVQTMSMHTPFVIPRMAHWRQQAQSRIRALGLNDEQREAALRQQDIYASILYTDDALRSLFERLAQQSAWKNTIVLVTGDHRLPEIPMDTRIERYHVPLIVHSPLLREPQRIKALSSHADIAPSLLAMLSHRYGWALPQRVHWMGQGLDLHAQWRNLHTVALKQTKTELSDYISGEFYLAQDRLMTLQDGLVAEPEENPSIQQAMRQELTVLRAGLAGIAQQGALVAEVGRQQRAIYTEAGRMLEPAHRARRLDGVVVTDAQGRFNADQHLVVQGQFTQQGGQDSSVFVPLLVLSDAQGRELAEVSGQAMRLKAGQWQAVQLQLPPRHWPAGTYYFSLIVSHPDTGRPIGKGQYHVAVVR